MKNLRLYALTATGLVLSGFLLLACGGAKPTNANANAATNKAPVPATQNANQSSPANNAPVATAADISSALEDVDEVEGELQVGKTESVILYVGMESGDYAAYCFANDSEGGRKILAACKDRDQVTVTGSVDYEGSCTVPGLEATLSASGRLSKVATVKSLGPRK